MSVQFRSVKPKKWDWDDIAVRLRKERDSRGLTQATVAERSGVSANYIAHIEGGGKVPAIPVLFDVITLGLGMSIQDFFEPLFPATEPDNASIEAESNALFEKYAYDERTRRPIWEFLKSIDETHSRRRPRK